MLQAKTIVYSKLFLLNDPLANRPIRLEPRGQNWVTDKMAWNIFKGELQPPEPVIMVGYMGGTVTEFLWSGFPPLFCVSKRIIDLLLINNFTGWSTYPVTVYDRNNIQISDYYGFAVKSYAGERIPSRSEVITKPPIVPGAKPMSYHKGLFFDEEKWDGNDIFRISGAHIIITDKVRKVLKKERITNIRIQPLSDVEINTYLARFDGNSE